MVTRSLVSYDGPKSPLKLFILKLNGHQIIGELRHPFRIDLLACHKIEWSPDHW